MRPPVARTYTHAPPCREYTCKVSTYRAKQMCCMCCLVSDVNLQSFDADLFLVKNVSTYNGTSR